MLGGLITTRVSVEDEERQSGGWWYLARAGGERAARRVSNVHKGFGGELGVGVYDLSLAESLSETVVRPV
jgi:hypothetical protein